MPGRAWSLTRNAEGGPGPDVRHGRSRHVSCGRDTDDIHPVLMFEINILIIMLCARCSVCWMQHSAWLGPLPLWMMDEPGPSQDRVCSPLPGQGLAPPPPLPCPGSPGTDINCQALIHFTGSNIQRYFYLGGIFVHHDFFVWIIIIMGLSWRDLLRAPDPGYENCPRMKPGASNEN